MLATLPRSIGRKYSLHERNRPGVSERGRTIKVLDLLSNRYYLGVVRGTSEGALEIDMPMASRLHVGQRVRFVVCENGGGGVIRRQAMRGAQVMRVMLGEGSELHVEIEPEMAAA